MTHIVLVKYKEGSFDESIRQLTENTFSALRESISGIRSVEVQFNCIEREANADVMVKLEFDDMAALEEYRRHPLHQGFASSTRHLHQFICGIDY